MSSSRSPERFFFVAKCNRLVFFEHLLIVCIPPRPMSRAYPRVHWRNDYLRIQCRTLTPASTDAMITSASNVARLPPRRLTQCQLPRVHWRNDVNFASAHVNVESMTHDSHGSSHAQLTRVHWRNDVNFASAHVNFESMTHDSHGSSHVLRKNLISSGQVK